MGDGYWNGYQRLRTTRQYFSLLFEQEQCIKRDEF